MSTITREFTKEQLQQIIETDHVQCGEASALARIALASLEAEFVGEVSEQRDGLVMDGTVDLGGASTHRIIKGASKMKRLPLGTKFYTSPPAPANAEPVAWLWSHRKHPSEVTLVRPEDDEMAEGSRWSGWSCQALYAAPPAPASVPDGYRLQPISEYDAMCAAMLQGADVSLTHEGKNHHEDKLGMVNHLGDVTEKVEPVTQIEPVADLYGLTSPTGGETSFTFDAVEARDFIDGGWSCQDYVELERFQEAVSGNSPVIPDGWVACSERLPENKPGSYEYLVFEGLNNRVQHDYWNVPDAGDDCQFTPFWNHYGRYVTHWMPLPAAPQQEVK